MRHGRVELGQRLPGCLHSATQAPGCKPASKHGLAAPGHAPAWPGPPSGVAGAQEKTILYACLTSKVRVPSACGVCHLDVHDRHSTAHVHLAARGAERVGRALLARCSAVWGRRVRGGLPHMAATPQHGAAQRPRRAVPGRPSSTSRWLPLEAPQARHAGRAQRTRAPTRHEHAAPAAALLQHSLRVRQGLGGGNAVQPLHLLKPTGPGAGHWQPRRTGGTPGACRARAGVSGRRPCSRSAACRCQGMHERPSCRPALPNPAVNTRPANPAPVARPAARTLLPRTHGPQRPGLARRPRLAGPGLPLTSSVTLRMWACWM